MPEKGNQRKSGRTWSRFNERSTTLLDSIPKVLHGGSIATIEFISQSDDRRAIVRASNRVCGYLSGALDNKIGSSGKSWVT